MATKHELIAIFMGIPKKDITKGTDGSIWAYNLHPDGMTPHAIKLEYHSSWDWIMPACKKFDTLYTGKDAPVGYVELCDSIDNAVSCYEIIWVFEALVNGIKWYNTQNKKP